MGRWNIPDNLCYYFWGVIFGLLRGLGAAFLVLFLGLVVMGWLFMLITPIWSNEVDSSIASMVLWIMTGIILIGFSRDYHEENKYDNDDILVNSVLFKEVVSTSKNSFFIVVIEYLKAKKEKFCPTIDFTD